MNQRISDPAAHYPRNYPSQVSYHRQQDSPETLMVMLETERLKNRALVMELERMKERMREKDAKIDSLEAELQECRKRTPPLNERRGSFIAGQVKTAEKSPNTSILADRSPRGSLVVNEPVREQMAQKSLMSPVTGKVAPTNPLYQQQQPKGFQQPSLVDSTSTLLSQSATDTQQISKPNLKEKMENLRFVEPPILNVFKRHRQSESVNSSLQTIILGPGPNSFNMPSSAFRLFQSFLIVSTDQISTNQNGKYLPVDPRILLRYPVALDANQAQIIPSFCFPRGIITRPLLQVEEASQVLKSNSHVFFTFTLCSDLTNNASPRVHNQVLEAINPSYRLYGICMKCKGVAKSATQQIYYQVPKIYVFFTYFPFVSFFTNALSLIVNTIRTEELDSLPHMPSPENNLLTRCLENMIKQSICNLASNMRFRCLEVHLTLAIPDISHVDQLLISWCLPCLSRLEVSILVDLFMFVLLEEFLLIHSTDLTLLSQTILLLLCVIRPFRYPFTVIMNLPQSMKYLLESPFPTIIGTYIPEEMWNSDIDLGASTSKSIYFNLDGQQSIRRRPENSQLNDYTTHLKRSFGQARQKSQMELYKRMRYALIYEILHPIQQGKKTSPFLKRIREGASYKLYQQTIAHHE